MNFREYQEKTKETAIYPKENNLGLYYVTMGLVGEAGEISNKVKKILRDNDNVITEQKRNELGKELQDVLWYTSAMATELGFDLEQLCIDNINKLASRKERGVIKGSGDSR